MRLHELQPGAGARQNSKRVGRGTGSGVGKTSRRGQKGQGSRSGGTKGPHFEGGQTPIQRRLPKRGFNNARFRQDLAVVNVGDLAVFESGTVVTLETLREAGLVKQVKDGVKILGDGTLTAKLTVQANGFSKSAVEKIENAGGKTEVI